MSTRIGYFFTFISDVEQLGLEVDQEKLRKDIKAYIADQVIEKSSDIQKQDIPDCILIISYYKFNFFIDWNEDIYQIEIVYVGYSEN